MCPHTTIYVSSYYFISGGSGGKRQREVWFKHIFSILLFVHARWFRRQREAQKDDFPEPLGKFEDEQSQANPKFTCFTGTKVQILTLTRLPGDLD
jgi:hypothetical protein